MMRLASIATKLCVRAGWLAIAIATACGDDSAIGTGPGTSSETSAGPDSDPTDNTNTSPTQPDTSADASGDSSTTGADTTTSTGSTGTSTGSSESAADVSTSPGCLDAAECDDENVCTIDDCDGGRCTNEALDGVPAPQDAQSLGDCSSVMCANGEASDEIDDTDVPDDGIECTDDVCMRGEPSNPPSMAGSSCVGDGVCDGAGACSECISPDDCDQFPPDDDCQQRTCIGNTCGQTFTDAGVEVNAAMQVAGDCNVVVCDGAGDTQDDPDDGDLPVDGLECTADECNGGVPENPALDAGAPCSAGVCDGDAGCVGCVTPADCGGTDTFCQTITCVDNVCGIDNTDIDTPLPAADQDDNDCQLLVCDGDGTPQSVADVEDIPLDDGNECTDEVCLPAGIPDHPDEPIDTTCNQNGGSFCDGSGDCVECNDDVQCSESDQCDVPACNGNVCGSDPLPLGTACDDELFCTNSDTCDGAGICVGAGDPCPGADSDGDCSESCSEQFDSCVGNDPDGATCDDGLFCSSGDTCNGAGTCQGGGSPCQGADGDGNCAESCDEAANSCNANDPGGSVCDDGLFCTGTDTCNGVGVCSGVGSPCMGPDADNNCQESCNEATNNCTANDPTGSSCNDGNFCTLVDTCNISGICGGSSNPCAGADGDFDCSEQCNEATNNCTGIDPNGSACQDNVFCNGTDQCQAGVCTPSGTNPCPGADGDGDCSEQCNEAADACTTNDPVGSACSDGMFCTGTDLCNNLGVCVPGANPCPGADGDADCSEVCNEVSDACSGNDPNNSACNDGMFCTLTDRCNGLGSCVGTGSPCDGSDNDNDCSEQCVEVGDSCTGNDTNNTVCNDDCGVCTGGTCFSSPICP